MTTGMSQADSMGSAKLTVFGDKSSLGGTPVKSRTLFPATLSNRSPLTTRNAFRQGEDMSLLKGEGNRSQVGGFTTSRLDNTSVYQNTEKGQ